MISIVGEFNRGDYGDEYLARLDLIGETVRWIYRAYGEENEIALAISGWLLCIAKEIIEAAE